MVAIGKSPIGIDVENRREDWDLIGKRVFSESEKYWSQNSYKRKAILWTIKEAYVKYLGIGLSKSLNSFSIDIKGKSSQKFKNHSKLILITLFWITTMSVQNADIPKVLIIAEKFVKLN